MIYRGTYRGFHGYHNHTNKPRPFSFHIVGPFEKMLRALVTRIIIYEERAHEYANHTI